MVNKRRLRCTLRLLPAEIVEAAVDVAAAAADVSEAEADDMKRRRSWR